MSILIRTLDQALKTCSTVGSHGFIFESFGFLYVKNGESLYFPQTAPLIEPDQKVAASAWSKVVVQGGERTSVSIGLNGGCVPADTPTLKSVEVQNEGFQSEEDSTLEAARSLLFIEVGECRAVVRHV